MVERKWNACVNPGVMKAIFLISIYTIALFLLFNFSFKLLSKIDFDFDYIHYNSDSMLPPYAKRQLNFWTDPAIERNPKNAVGEFGFAVDENVTRDGLYTLMFNKHKFNLRASDKIGLKRTLKDNRFKMCLKKSYPRKLQTASVIIVFHNEAFSTLIRTVQSVIQTSPEALLREVILVDDSSYKVSLKYHLKYFIKQFNGLVRLVRMSIRSGVIKGRNFGSTFARGEVLVFLDSHCECNEGWLAPLLARIVEDRTRVVSPIRDVIDANTFAYKTVSSEIYGGFDWRIRFRWFRIPQRLAKERTKDYTQPIKSPTLNGGIFAIDKQFFNYFEKHDNNLSYFGSDQVEIALAAWTCGGSVEIIPCSRVGHVFRDSIPYSFPGSEKTIRRYNAARVLETWMPEYQLFFYNLFPDVLRKSRGNVTHRLDMRDNLNCKDMMWYLENVFPESTFPRKYKYLGQIEHIHTKYCLDSLYSLLTNSEQKKMRYCVLDIDGRSEYTFSQQFVYTEDDEIVHDGRCLDVNEDGFVVLRDCEKDLKTQRWFHSRDLQIIKHKTSGLCLLLNDTKLAIPALSECLYDNKYQKWFMTDNFLWIPSFHKKLD